MDTIAITEETLRPHLTTKRYGHKLLAYGQAGSTNDIALRYARGSLSNPDGTLVVAEYQTQGRGRFGRRWFSPRSANLLFSLVVCPEPCLPRPALLTLAMGVSIVAAVGKITPARCRLKWPNDVLLNGKKLAGILTESGVWRGGKPFWVVGVGVNVNVRTFPEEMSQTATSLWAEIGEETSRSRLLAAILGEYEKECELLFAGNTEALLATARILTTTLGRVIALQRGETLLTGVACDLNEEGALLVRTPSGRIFTARTSDEVLLL